MYALSWGCSTGAGQRSRRRELTVTATRRLHAPPPCAARRSRAPPASRAGELQVKLRRGRGKLRVGGGATTRCWVEGCVGRGVTRRRWTEGRVGGVATRRRWAEGRWAAAMAREAALGGSGERVMQRWAAARVVLTRGGGHGDSQRGRREKREEGNDADVTSGAAGQTWRGLRTGLVSGWTQHCRVVKLDLSFPTGQC